MSPKPEIESIQTAVIIGAGNLAWHMGHSLTDIGIRISGIYNRTNSRGKVLADSIGTTFFETVEDIDRSADLTVLAVSDDATGPVACSLGFLNSGILIHTAGTVPMDVLSVNAKNYGVLYPLQTFTAGRRLNFRDIPLLLEANDRPTFEKIEKLAFRLSGQVKEMSSENRMILHLSAIISSNFANHLFTMSEKVLADNGHSFSLLKPLLEETIAKAFENGPARSQTGPAVRGNRKIIDRHLSFLEKYPDIREIYRILSDSILKSSKIKTGFENQD